MIAELGHPVVVAGGQRYAGLAGVVVGVEVEVDLGNGRRRWFRESELVDDANEVPEHDDEAQRALAPHERGNVPEEPAGGSEAI